MKDETAIINEESTAHINSDLCLIELAGRNPSLGGRELLREIIERGSEYEENERRQAINIRDALRTPGIDDPNYRTQSEQPDWIGRESKIMRDLYERGAQIKGGVLIIPAESHKQNEDRETPFITTISYALEKIDDVERAAEFHSLAQKISGSTADARTRIVVFRTFYGETAAGGSDRERALNSSPQFRLARQEFINAQSPEDLGRAAENFLRINRHKSEELRISLDPDRIPFPDSLPLNVRERSLLFNGRAPDHHTREMRELRINYGLSRLERSDRVEKLSRGLIEPADSLRQILDELETRKTAKAIGHFQASLFNPEMNTEGKPNLSALYHRIPPHERTYLYQLSENRKQDLQHSRHQPLARKEEPGAMPRESESLREYLSHMSRIERRLLNEEIIRLGINVQAGSAGESPYRPERTQRFFGREDF